VTFFNINAVKGSL